MKNFNIKKIKLKSKNEPSLEKRLTGEVISEIKSPMIEPNAELEGEEVLQFPDGVMHTVKGNPHSKGGVKMNIPDGTRILSKFLTLSKNNVADAKELYDVALTTKDSFAKAQEKFEKKIGLKRLFDEQEQMIKMLKTELEKKNVPEATFRLNQQYISEKINEIEEMKQSKEGVRADFFDFIFNAQEESKEKDKKNMPKKGEMKYGGIFNKFEVGGEMEEEMPSKYMPITSGMETAFIPLSRDGYQEPVISPVEMFCPEGYEWDSNSQSCVPVRPVQNFDGNNINVFKTGGTVMIDYEAIVNESNTYGGLSKEKFDKVRNKYGFTEEQALAMLNTKKFQVGGTQATQSATFVTVDKEGNYSLTEIGPGVNNKTVLKASDVEKNPDGSVKLKKGDATVSYPLYATTSTGGLSKVSKDNRTDVDQVLTSQNLLESKPASSQQRLIPEGLTGKQYMTLKRELDTPMKIAKAFADGKITSEVANRIQYDMDNSRGFTTFRTTTKGKHAYSDTDAYQRVQQAKGKAAFGKIGEEDVPYVMEYLYRNFPDIVTSEDVFGVKFEDGKISYNKDLDFSKVLPQVKKFQERANKRMKSTAQTILNNPELFDEASVKDAQSFVEKETFSEGLTARGFDSKLGNFTSGRFNKGVDVVTPEEEQALANMGIFTTKQLQEAVKTNPELISESSRLKLETLSDIMEEDADFVLNPYEQMKEKPKEEPKEEPKKEDKIEDDIVTGRPKLPTMYDVPTYYPLPPTPLQAHMFPESKFGLIDPVRIGIEQQIQTSGESMKLAADQLQGLPPQQRAIVIAQMQADRQRQLNEEAYKANIVNAQNLSQTELFNIGQRDKQGEADIRNKLNFEQRQFTALANTEEDLRRYSDRLNDLAMNRTMVNKT